MPEGALALSIIFGWIVFIMLVGVSAGLRRRMTIEEYYVAGRTLGVFIIFFALAAEIYSGFTFLGVSGWAYKYGVPILYALVYGTLAYVVGYNLLPVIWRLAKARGYLTMPDFFTDRFQSKLVGVVAALIALAYILPYLQLQIGATSIIIELGSYGAINAKVAAIIAYILTMTYIIVGGLRGIAWTNVIMGALMLILMVLLSFYIPHLAAGGIHEMFLKIKEISPQHLTLPGAAGTMGLTWFISAFIMSSLGFFMWPHLFQSTFAAKSDKTLRRSAVMLPIYQLLSIAILPLVGFAALILFPKLDNPDHALLLAARKFFPEWFVGLVGAGGVAAALSTASMLILTPASITVRNLVQAARPDISERGILLVTRIFVFIYTFLALLLWLFAPNLLVALLLFGYTGITQFFPVVVLSLIWKRVNKPAALAGLIVGTIVAIITYFVRRNPYGIWAGIWGMIFNTLAIIIVGYLTRPQDEEFINEIFSIVRGR